MLKRYPESLFPQAKGIYDELKYDQENPGRILILYLLSFLSIKGFYALKIWRRY